MKKKPSYEKNKGLWKKVIELAEDKQGNVKFPFMIQGFYTLSDETERDSGAKIIPTSNFEIIEDERLSGKYNERRFNNVDENGLPIFDKNGKFAFYSRDDGLSGVCLYGDGDLYTWNVILAYSNDYGRVVLVNDAEGVALKNFDVEKFN